MGVTKYCKRCDVDTKRNSRGKCMPCANARVAAWRKANKETKKESDAAYRASHREQESQRKSLWYAENKDRQKLALSSWRSKNPEANRIHCQNRRSAYIGRLSSGLFAKLFALQRGKCACCKADFAEIKPHMDHVMPLALGGANDDANMQLLCQPCNNQKHAKHPIDFMQQKGFLI